MAGTADLRNQLEDRAVLERQQKLTGVTIGTFTAVDNEQAQETCTGPTDSVSRSGRDTFGRIMVPVHLQQLLQAAKGGCKGPRETQIVANLLTRCDSVFSNGNSDVRRTTLVEHSIPLMEETRPVRQSPHHLGLKKEAEADG